MVKLEKALKEWQALGFLNPEQARQIQQHEASKSSGWVLSGLLTLGVTVIAIGLISLIAANWQQIPAAIKLAGDFLLLILLGIGIFFAHKNQRSLLFEILLLAFLLLCLASIGLIAQIYQTGGELYQALMLWSIITVGIVCFSRHLFTPFIWIGGFLIALISMAGDSPLFWSIFGHNTLFILVAIPLFCWSMALLIKRRSSFSNIAKAFEIWAVISGFYGIVHIELDGSRLAHLSIDTVAYVPGLILATVAIIATWFSRRYRFLQKILLSAAMLIYLLLFALPIMAASDLVYALITLLILSLMAVFFASLKRRGLFQFFLILVGLRLLILYFQALGGLALTGIGLVIAGILIIAMGVLWNKYRTRLAIRIERWTQS